MAKRKAEPEKAENQERWLLTYADLITLLMIFFVLMYTISNVNSKKFAQLSASMSQALLGQNSGHFIGESQGPTPINDTFAKKNKAELESMKKAQNEIEKLVKDQGLAGKVEVSQMDRGLVISLKEALLFNSGSADITPNAKDIVVKVGKILVRMSNQIRIEGHTDNLPIHNQIYPSNWELSTTRATNVVKLLINQVGFSPQNLSATGYGEYRPIVSNNTNLNRATNRRVDIVVLRSVFDIAEPKINEKNLNQVFTE